MASQEGVLIVPVVLLKSFHSFMLSSTLCVSSSFFATFCSNWNLEPFLLSQSGGSQDSFGMIVRAHPGRYFLRVILQSKQHYSEVHFVYMDGCQSHDRGCNHCEIAHADFTLVKFHSLRQRHPFQWQKSSSSSLPVVQRGKPLAPLPSSGRHEIQTNLFRISVSQC